MKPGHAGRSVNEVLFDFVTCHCREERSVCGYVYAYEYDEKRESRTSALRRMRARGPGR
jgi:hypothetical protein